MPRLIRRRRPGDADRGAVTALVAILLSSGVLLTMTAFSVDLGTMYAYRDQALNAANAAAMAAAQVCVRPGGRCGNVANGYAAANISGMDVVLDSADVSGQPVCGNDTDTAMLHQCTDPTGAKRCIGTRNDRTSYAEVHATTKARGSSTVFPPSFAGQAVPGYRPDGVQACARVAWGPPRGPYAGFGLSRCVFDRLTGGKDKPRGFSAPYSPPDEDDEVRLDLQPGPPTSEQGCGDRGFGNLAYLGFLEQTPPADYRCTVDWPDVHQNGTVDGHTNNATGTFPLPDACRKLLDSKERRPVPSDQKLPSYEQPFLLMPIYESYSPDDTGTEKAHTDFETIYGIAGFQVTCDHLDATGTHDWLTGRDSSCGGSTPSADRYLRGYFVWANLIDGTWPSLDWNHTLGVATFKTVG